MNFDVWPEFMRTLMKTDEHVWPECIQTCMELIQGRNAKFLRTDSQARHENMSAIQTDDHVWPEFLSNSSAGNTFSQIHMFGRNVFKHVWN